MIQIFTPTAGENRQESFWYHGKQIASVTMPDGTVFSLESSGEQKVTFGEVDDPDAEGITLSGEEAVTHAINAGMTDGSLDNEENVFHMNNWFAIRELKPNTTEGPDDDLFIVHTYTDGIQQLVELMQELQNAEEEEAV